MSRAILTRLVGYLAATAVVLMLVSVGLYAQLLTQPLESTSPRYFVATSTETVVVPFPVSVDPVAEEIVVNPALETYLAEELAIERTGGTRTSWWEKLERVVMQSGVFQQLAASEGRILVIWAGERKEEVAANFANILRWDQAGSTAFTSNIAGATGYPEGAFLPGRYVTHKNASPEEVSGMLAERFHAEVLARYPDELEATVPLDDALTIASLLEREAYSFDHMRTISGVIWNRLFIDMPLQIDATLQYVRGSKPYEPWWPVPVPADKFLDSPYNTYQHAGLPPGPIANPSVEAIVAALNPYPTECYFYFHTNDGELICTETYEDHVRELRRVFGRGS
jgi:cell division protein YceG involved in septum cleavage